MGGQTWVLPASTDCGSENEPQCEPVGHFISPDPWVGSAIGTWVILEGPQGGISDVIKTFNNADGQAELLFYSDPTLSSIPEPSTWAMMVIGFAGLGYAAFYRSRKAPAFIG